MIQDFSSIPQCNTSYDDYNHRLFLTSNERGFDQTLEKYAQAEATGNTLIGVSGFFILDLAAARQVKPLIKNIILLDRSDRVQFFWHAINEIVKTSSHFLEATQKIKQHLLNEKNRYFSSGWDYNDDKRYEFTLSTLENHIRLNLSWLSSEEKYGKIHKIFIKNRFTFLKLDFFEDRSFPDLANCLKTKNYQVDTLYLSNIWEYADSLEQRQNYYRNIKQIILPATSLILTNSGRCIKCEPLNQRLISLKQMPLIELIPIENFQFCSPCSEKVLNFCMSELEDNTLKPYLPGLFNRVLFDGQANINTQNNQGNTPLILAASKGHTLVVKQLLDAGCDRSLRDQNGQTALDRAIKSGFKEIVALLEAS